MKVRLASIFFLVGVLVLPVISLGQDQRNSIPTERKSIDWFYRDANSRAKPLLLKLLQFTAPYSGFYQQTTLNTNGKASTARNVPDWAMQNSSSAILDDALLTQIKTLLAELNVPATTAFIEPEYNRLHSVFVFYDGHDFRRLNYNGPNPPQIDAILEILHKEFKRENQAQEDRFAAHLKLMHETYGDWQNRPGVTINTGGGMHGCKGNRALVVSVIGVRKTVPDNPPVPVAVYHALVFYPVAAVIRAGSSGWKDDPVQSYELTWKVPSANGSFSENTSEQKFVIQHHAIDATITIAGKPYQLTAGNMFIIRIGDDWQPTVTQLNDIFDDQTPNSALNRFKTLLKGDASIQQLELY